MLIEKYGKEEANKRIYATTDRARGALKNLANEEGYESFVVPDDVGGRFSVLTAVGLLPIAVSGADIDALMQGAADARKNALETPFEKNSALLYAAVRNILLRKGKQVEIVANYEPSLHYVSEWWKQLYGESEGKDQKGIFPAAVDLTTDLHSMGQFIQDGARIMFETVLEVAESPAEVILKKEDVDTDGMNYLAGKSVDFVNKSAMNGTILAHTDGSVPNLKVTIPAMDAYSLGQLFYFFEFACGGLYVKPGLSVEPLLVGGSGIHSYDEHHPKEMPTALEAGTLNVHGLAGLAAGIRYRMDQGIEKLQKRERDLTRRFYEQVKEIPGIIVYGDPAAKCHAPIVSLNLAGEDSARVADALWEEYGICVRAGAHCAPLMHRALGTVGQGVVRFSFSHFNTEEEIERAAEAVRALAEEA